MAETHDEIDQFPVPRVGLIDSPSNCRRASKRLIESRLSPVCPKRLDSKRKMSSRAVAEDSSMSLRMSAAGPFNDKLKYWTCSVTVVQQLIRQIRSKRSLKLFHDVEPLYGLRSCGCLTTSLGKAVAPAVASAGATGSTVGAGTTMSVVSKAGVDNVSIAAVDADSSGSRRYSGKGSCRYRLHQCTSCRQWSEYSSSTTVSSSRRRVGRVHICGDLKCGRYMHISMRQCKLNWWCISRWQRCEILWYRSRRVGAKYVLVTGKGGGGGRQASSCRRRQYC